VSGFRVHTNPHMCAMPAGSGTSPRTRQVPGARHARSMPIRQGVLLKTSSAACYRTKPEAITSAPHALGYQVPSMVCGLSIACSVRNGVRYWNTRLTSRVTEPAAFKGLRLWGFPTFGATLHGNHVPAFARLLCSTGTLAENVLQLQRQVTDLLPT